LTCLRLLNHHATGRDNCILHYVANFLPTAATIASEHPDAHDLDEPAFYRLGVHSLVGDIDNGRNTTGAHLMRRSIHFIHRWRDALSGYTQADMLLRLNVSIANTPTPTFASFICAAFRLMSGFSSARPAALSSKAAMVAQITNFLELSIWSLQSFCITLETFDCIRSSLHHTQS
jgi:hypothetical protein